MSNGGSSLWSERLVNGEKNSIDATGAVSGSIGGGGRGGGCVGGGGSVSSGVSSRSGVGGGCDNIADSGGKIGGVPPAVTVTAAVIGGGGAADGGLTLLDARGTTPAVNRRREATRIGDCDDARTGRRLESVILQTTTPPTTTANAGNNASIVSGTSASTLAAVVVVDTASTLFDDDDIVDDEEEEEEEDVGDRHYRHKRGIMVAAMNEHLSNTTTTSSPANGARSTSSSTVATLSSSSSTSSAIVNTNSSASTTTSTAISTAGVVGIATNNNNSCGNARSQEFQDMDGDDIGKNVVASTTTGPAGILSFPCDFDHMYASMTDGGTPAAATASAVAAAAALGVSPLRGNEPRQNDLTEVKHLKELLLLHLDLIQQQSEQIVTKDKLLAALRQENETLKLRLERMERRVNLQKLRSECSSENSAEHLGTCSPPGVNTVNTASTSEPHRNVQSESGNTLHESFKIRLNTSGGITTVKQEPLDNQIKHEVKQEASDTRFEWEEKKKRRSDPTPLSTGSKKKRGLSCSSTINIDASSNVQDKVLTSSHEPIRKNDRKTKSLAKKESFLTTEEHYYTAVGDPSYTLSLKQSSPVETCNSLEVPNWRVKIYTSCYTMEGTENLDDEIFNKRHLKLENDERRRKRWDVQRIREQRHIEKLKQRQERQNHQATCYNTNHTGPCPSSLEEETITSLWPDVDQIQSLQVDPHLPVTAFGTPIPSFTPSEFSLPWSNTTRIKCRRPKRSTSRRKSTGRRKV
ncbi:PREDICTED: male-specific lethal 1 homolog [Dinoponera quadriceps]|uniref:Male-specific lethal 1 homolog n=1 Tax=Dinoponera quadriceps TaxID=609295 RepID=A0A6P3WNZ0_DINQU|nr:PREDICTED: male-specific lethal 1 homolog [Dinoponera quadriceps]